MRRSTTGGRMVCAAATIRPALRSTWPVALVLGIVLWFPHPARPVPPAEDDGVAPPTARSTDVRAELPNAELPEEVLTLERALDIALANSPGVAAGGWEVEAARARTRQASAERWPSLDLDAAYRHHWHEERLVPAREPEAFVTSHDLFSGDVVLTVPLLSGGRVVESVAAADLLARAAEQRLARTREELAFDVASTFYAILGQRQLVAAIEHSRDAVTEHLHQTELLIEARKAARVDRLNLEVRLADLERRLIEQRGVHEIHELLLLRLLGFEAMPPGGLRIEGSLEAVDIDLDREQLRAAAIEARPDIAELTLAIEAQSRAVRVARSAYWPEVAARGTYGGRLSTEGETADLGYAGVGLSMPVLTGLRTPARVSEEQATLRSLQERKRGWVLAVQQEVDSAIIEVESAMAAVRATGASITGAEESLRIARDEAALGRATAMDVLDAQSALLLAETTYAGALVDLHTALARLELATGSTS